MITNTVTNSKAFTKYFNAFPTSFRVTNTYWKNNTPLIQQKINYNIVICGIATQNSKKKKASLLDFLKVP